VLALLDLQPEVVTQCLLSFGMIWLLTVALM